MAVSLRTVTRGELAAYLETAAETLAGELSRAMRISIEVARGRAESVVGSLISGSDPDELGDGVFACSVIGDGGEVVGLVLFGHPDYNGARYYVWDIVIDPSFRGRGYGRAAMQAIEEHARARGVAIIELNVFAHNTIARQLYGSLGYVEGGVRMVKEL